MESNARLSFQLKTLKLFTTTAKPNDITDMSDLEQSQMLCFSGVRVVRSLDFCVVFVSLTFFF